MCDSDDDEIHTLFIPIHATADEQTYIAPVPVKATVICRPIPFKRC